MIQLFTTSACHLCELAADVLQKAKLEVQAIEIADDEALIERYGTRIPVLKRLDTAAELNWPFTSQDIERFIA
jgi:hypothetical protein